MRHAMIRMFRATIPVMMLFGLASPSQAATRAADSALFEQLEARIADETYKQITSVVMQHNGKRVYEKYFSGANSQTLHNIRSASKSFTAMLFGIAAEQGLFQSEEDLVLPLFADKAPHQYPFEAKTALKFSDLLSMTSALECDDFTEFSEGNEERMYIRRDWLQFVLDLPERGTPPWELPASEQPYGRDFAYCTAGVFLIGAAIERASGQSLDAYAQKTLFGPLGIEKSNWARSPEGIVQGGGGVELASNDLIALGQLMLDQGRHADRQLISSRWVSKMMTPRSLAMPDEGLEYGYLWWMYPYTVGDRELKAWTAGGNGGNYLIVVPELNLTALVTSTAYNTRYMHTQTRAIIGEFLLPAALAAQSKTP